MRILLFLCLVLSGAFPGCAYFHDRCKDASEVVEAGVGFALGVEANVRAFKPFQVGLGSYYGPWIGLHEGRLAVWYETRVEMGLPFYYLHEVYRKDGTLPGIAHPNFGEAAYSPYMNDLFLFTDRGFFEVGVTMALLVPGVDLSVDLAETTDFLLGWFGVDLLEDDAYVPSLEELVRRVGGMGARRRAAAVRALRRRTGLSFGYEIVTVPSEHTEAQIEAWHAWRDWLKNQTAQAP